MQRIVTRVLHGLAARFGSVDEGKPTLIDWSSPATPVVDVSRAASAHSPNFSDGWVDVSFLCEGNVTAAAELEFQVNLAGSLLGAGGAGGGSVNVQGDQPCWITSISCFGRAAAPTAGRIALYRSLGASTVVEAAQVIGIWGTNTAGALVPFDPSTPDGTAFGLVASVNGLALQPVRMAQGDLLTIVSQDIDSGAGEQVSVNLRLWTSPDGAPPPAWA